MYDKDKLLRIVLWEDKIFDGVKFSILDWIPVFLEMLRSHFKTETKEWQ